MAKPRKPLAYHLPSAEYGKGICGKYGMMAAGIHPVTCERCATSPRALVAATMQSRYRGAR